MENKFNDIPVVILAGGKSSRMGSPKGLLLFEEDPWIIFQIKKIESVGLSKILIVLGYGAEGYLDSVDILKAAQNRWIEWPALTKMKIQEAIDSTVRIKVVINKNPEFGPFSSIVTGLREVKNDHKVFILPVDVPCPAASVWTNLYQEQRFNSYLKACVPEFSRRGGHPILIHNEAIKNLLDVPISSDEARLDFQLAKLSDSEKKRVSVNDPLICYNINTPEDWMRLKADYHKYSETVAKTSG